MLISYGFAILINYFLEEMSEKYGPISNKGGPI
jgi:hypothetical protein